MEDNLASKYQRQASLPEATFPKPIFVVPLEAEFILAESKPLHLEAQVEPKNDPNLKIEWYFNGKVLDLGKIALMMLRLFVIISISENLYFTFRIAL